ncbi:FHA domain-containing protein [Catenulispora subtropica]|uniref:FHA domain-containing protein n=1 Tax=Catenulispora subtropica TaxID=450798 RepID=A0ABN2RDK2_9ACTN
MQIRDFIPQVLPQNLPSLAGGVPPAPPGTIFVKAGPSGFAVPPRKFTLHFGRAEADVHVVIGGDDEFVSRLAGIFTCDGEEWWLRNEGRRPILMPGAEPVLRHHEVSVNPGFTPMTIETPNRRTHLLEVHLVGSQRHASGGVAQSRTLTSDVTDLAPVERLMMIALAQRYLRREPYPAPVTWKQAADDLNAAAPNPLHPWTAKAVERRISELRARLSTGPGAIRGIVKEPDMVEPLGNTLNDNLIRALLRNATLVPEDLYALGEDV